MNGGNRRAPGDLKVDQANLYREELFTDLKVATIRRLTPVKPDGQVDAGRKTLFIGQSSVLTQAGPIPVDVPIDAADLKEALDRFPESLNRAIEDLMAEVEEMRRREATRIVMPPSGAGKILMP